jgi:hypothetical protein
MRCHCPAKHFRNVRQALQYARRAADTFRVAYAVWRVRNGTLRLRKQYAGFRPARQTERAPVWNGCTRCALVRTGGSCGNNWRAGGVNPWRKHPPRTDTPKLAQKGTVP